MARKDQSHNPPAKRAPFDQSPLANCLACFEAYPHVALAVSGGADSTALTLLTMRWLNSRADDKSNSPDITVLTVDHGLRAESAVEAKWVAELSARLRFRHA